MAGRTKQLIVVLDASAFISALIKPDSIPERALLRAVQESNRLLLSEEVEHEYRTVIARPKFDRLVSIERRNRMFNDLLGLATRVMAVKPVSECSDTKDDKYLALAASGQADVIVSGDVRHLLSMHPWRGISILSPTDFMTLA